MKNYIIILPLLFLFSCEDSTDNDKTDENNIIFVPKKMYSSSADPSVELKYLTVPETSSRTKKERVWVYHRANYSLTASSTIVLKSLGFNWELIEEYETNPSQKLYWEYGRDYGGSNISDLTITIGTELMFRLPKSFVGHVSVSDHDPPDTEQDSLDRIRIHDILDFYSVPTFPFEVRATGYYLLSGTDTSHFNVVYLDTFTVTIDSTGGN